MFLGKRKYVIPIKLKYFVNQSNDLNVRKIPQKKKTFTVFFHRAYSFCQIN